MCSSDLILSILIFIFSINSSNSSGFMEEDLRFPMAATFVFSNSFIFVGDEGGFAPNLAGHEQAFQYIVKAIEEAGYTPGSQIALGIDAAASEFLQDGKYRFAGENKVFTARELTDYYADLAEKFPIVSIEDGLAEGDWEGWEVLSEVLGDRMQLVGDDIFVTNPTLLADGIRLLSMCHTGTYCIRSWASLSSSTNKTVGN